MRLDCYPLIENPPVIAAASRRREWMEAHAGRHPYRCLPLAIANGAGWEIRCPMAFEIEWNGGPRNEDLQVRSADGADVDLFVQSHFQYGIVTMHTGYVIQTDPGWNLMVTGPFNQPKDGIYAMTGVVETDWLPYPFTMNWQLTRPGTVRFEKDEAFCMFFPVLQHSLEWAEPRIMSLSDDRELLQRFDAWRDKRRAFLSERPDGKQWQRDYFKGETGDAKLERCAHVQKLKIKEPETQP